MATTLGLSPTTVICHRQHIFQKLNLHSLADLILYAVRKGIISTQSSGGPRLESSGQAAANLRAGVRRLPMRGGLVLGFGVLLILLILSGLSALHALSELQNANETTLHQFLAKNQQLDEIQAAVYLSGTYLRDYLLEPDRAKAEQSRRELIDANARIQSLLADNGPLSGAARPRDVRGSETRDARLLADHRAGAFVEPGRAAAGRLPISARRSLSRGGRIRWRSPIPSGR